MYNVFIRYSAEDAAAANRLSAYLEQNGAECYTVSGRIAPASAASARHNEAISSMRVYVVVCGGTVPADAAGELYLVKQRENVRVIAYLTADTPTPEGAERIEAYPDEEQALARTAQLVGEQVGRYPQKNASTAAPIAAHSPEPLAEKPAKPKKALRLGAVLGTVAAIAVLAVGGMAFLTNTKTGHRILDMLDGVSVEAANAKPGPNQIKYFGHNYSGEYTGETDKDGTADGTGHFSGSDGKRTLEIDGTFAEGVPTGNCRSTLIFPNGGKEEYDGGFEDSEYKGQGTSTYFYAEGESGGDKEKKVMKGEWLDGDNLAEGSTDTVYYRNGKVRVFTGSWANGKWNGAGVLKFTYPADNSLSDSVVEGVWSNGALNGTIKDTENYRDGDSRVYEGEYSDENWNGKGVLTINHTNGSKSVLEGTWSDGKLVTGTDTDYDKDGKVTKTSEINIKPSNNGDDSEDGE